MLTHHSGFRLWAQTPAKRLKFDAVYAEIRPNNTKSTAIAALFILSDCYIQNSIPEGVIVPSFEVYIQARIRSLVKNRVGGVLTRILHSFRPGTSASLGAGSAGHGKRTWPIRRGRIPLLAKCARNGAPGNERVSGN
jgi:hypothetical protein